MMKIHDVSGYRHTNISKELSKKKLKKLKEWRGRIDLLKDFSFPASATRIEFTGDKSEIVACGVYPPQFKVFSLSDLGSKFSRSLGSQNIDMCICSEDWKRLAFLQENTKLEFHNEKEMVETVQMPWLGRKMFFDRRQAAVVCAGVSSSGCLFDMNKCMFSQTFKTSSPSLSACCYSNMHGMYVFGGVDGRLHFFDTRAENAVALKEKKGDGAVSSLLFHSDGLTVCAGTEEGYVRMYDIRGTRQVLEKDHLYGEAIFRLEESGGHILSSDPRVLRIWNKKDGRTVGSIETSSSINDFCSDGGYIAICTEEEAIQSFYVPGLGNAPRWASAIDAIVGSASSFKDHVFVGADAPEESLEQAVPCMHGYILPDSGSDEAEEPKRPKTKQKKGTGKVGSVWG
eukprot:GHVN01067969.1.p2 GENE.GHVN01067969.1~~GHVN01067969.1.p2  ORF type:complete len:399 (+),score=42.32 GHVN01067969.1:1250-2446(+)